jgi:hypothetical protein
MTIMGFVLALLEVLLKAFLGGASAPKDTRKEVVQDMRKTLEKLNGGWKKAQETGDTSDLERID